MTTLAASAVDWGALGKVVVASLISGIGITLCFSVAIVGSTRFAELRRDNRVGVAALYGALGVAGLVATVGAVVVGIVVMTKKS